MEFDKAMLFCLLLFIYFPGDSTGQRQAGDINVGIITYNHIFLMRSYRGALAKAIRENNNEFKLHNYTLKGYMETYRQMNREQIMQNARVLVNKGPMTIVFASDHDHRDPWSDAPEDALMRISSFPGINTFVLLWNADGYIPPPTGTSRILAMMPTLRQQVCAMKQFVQEFGLTDIIILTQYLGKSRVDATECGAGSVQIVDLRSGIRGALQGIAKTTSSSNTKVILLLSRYKTAKMVLEEAASLKMTGQGYLWFLSSGAVGNYQITRTPDQFPAGIFGITYDTVIKDVIKRSVDMWAQGVATDLESHSVFNFSNMYRGIQAGFDDFGGYNGASVKILNLDNAKEWQQIGTWSKDGGVNLQRLIWPGGVEGTLSLPQNSPGGAAKGQQVLNEVPVVPDRR